MVRHSFQFLFDSVEAHRYVFHRDAHDGGYLVVADILQPEEHDGPVEGLEAMDAVVEQPYLTVVLVAGFAEQVDVGQRSFVASLLASFVRYAGVEADPPYPAFQFASSFKSFPSLP